MSRSSYIGIDLGGTKAVGALLVDGQLENQESLKTRGLTREELMGALDGLVRDLLDERPDVAAIGLGIPSQIDQGKGIAVASVNVPIENMAIRKEFEERFGLPVAVENDANCAAYAESRLGAGVGANVLICLTVGTGIGSGVVIDGEIMRGCKGYATEAGHMIVDLGCPDAEGFPKPGSLESHASGKALEAMAGGLSGEEAFELAKSGDRVMVGLFEKLARCLGIGIANMINIFNPDVVAIGGGISNAGTLLLDPAIEEAKKWALEAPMREARIVLAELGPEAGVIGAALVAGDTAS